MSTLLRRYISVPACVAMAAVLCSTAHAAGADAAPPSQAQGWALAQDKSCLRCHAVERHFVGPSFQQIADRYRGDPGAADRLATKIRQGSVGQWGRVIMPRQPQVSAADAAVLAAWVTQQGQPAR